MFSPTKNVENIKDNYLDASTNKPLNPQKGSLNFRQLCKPDMNWVYYKCMMKSHKYKEIKEENHKIYYELSPEIAEDEAQAAEMHNKIFNSYDITSFRDPRTENQIFLTCSHLYYEQCKDFYEKRLK